MMMMMMMSIAARVVVADHHPYRAVRTVCSWPLIHLMQYADVYRG